MQNKGKRDRLISEYNSLLEKQKRIRDDGEYDKIAEIHRLIHKKKEEIESMDK